MLTRTKVTRAPLTESGLGVELTVRQQDEGIAQEIRDEALAHGAVVVRGLEFDEPAFQEFGRSLGDLIGRSFGEGSSGFVELSGAVDEGKIVTGRGPLPLHQDGFLYGDHPDLILLYAIESNGANTSGRTTICDQITAWAEMPERLAKVLTEGALEYLVEDREFILNVPDDWYEIPTSWTYHGTRTLNISLPFEPGVPRGWTMRVAGMSENDSQAFYAELDQWLNGPRYLYAHQWQQGDLLVINNPMTLHGRTALRGELVRRLLRCQITVPQAA